jgi:hypothetical protein
METNKKAGGNRKPVLFMHLSLDGKFNLVNSLPFKGGVVCSHYIYELGNSVPQKF